MTNTMIPPHRPDAPPAARLLGLWLRRSMGIGTVAAIAAAAVVTCTLVALPIMLSRPRVYGAQADVLITPRAGQSDAATDRALATQEIILRSETVLDPVADATGIPVRRLEKALSVEVVNQSNVVRITMADRDAATAQRLTQLIVEGYEQQTSFPTVADLARSTSFLEEQLRDLSATLAVDQGRLAKLASGRGRGPGKAISTEERRLQVVVATTQQRLKIVQDQLAQAPLRQLEQAQPQPQVLVPAHVLKDPLSPRPAQAAASGALVGLFVAAAIILVLFRPRFTEERDPWG
jgi:uncharacterized protein involved in exopolysaccharide biosynthesis